MLFRTEGCVYYFWNNDFPSLVSLPEDTNPNAYYWMGMPARDMPPTEITALREIAAAPKKRIFTLPLRGKMKFIIEARGVFLEE